MQRTWQPAVSSLKSPTKNVSITAFLLRPYWIALPRATATARFHRFPSMRPIHWPPSTGDTPRCRPHRCPAVHITLSQRRCYCYAHTALKKPVAAVSAATSRHILATAGAPHPLHAVGASARPASRMQRVAKACPARARAHANLRRPCLRRRPLATLSSALAPCPAQNLSLAKPLFASPCRGPRSRRSSTSPFAALPAGFPRDPPPGPHSISARPPGPRPRPRRSADQSPAPIVPSQPHSFTSPSTTQSFPTPLPAVIAFASLASTRHPPLVMTSSASSTAAIHAPQQMF